MHTTLFVVLVVIKRGIPEKEKIVSRFWNISEPDIDNGNLHEVKLFESERDFVVYHGDSIERPH